MFDSLRGHFLIAATHLRDGNFYKAVVLILEHNAEGAMGLVLNRPMDANVSEALASHFEMPESADLLFNGGPVETNALLILHNSIDYDQEHEPIVPGVFVGTSPDVFDKVAASVGDPGSGFRFRIYAGYSGWGEGQLEQEMARGDWFALPADSDIVFRDNPYEIWEDVMRAFHEQHRILPGQPLDPDLN